jgi:predicted Zn-dependent protease
MDAVADGLSLYLLSRAGYNIDAAAPFWKRLAATYPATVLNSYVANHPATAARLAAIEKTSADIKAKGNKKP